MELKEHPAMGVGSHRNWPPVWVWIGGKPDTSPIVKTGVLKAVRRSMRPPVKSDRLFLVMEDREALYMTCFLFDDRSFCEWLFTTLNMHLGETIEIIGSLDVSETL